MKELNYYKFRMEIDELVNKYQYDEELGEAIRRLVCINEGGQILLNFAGDIGVKYRVVVPYLGRQYVVCWFQFCKDGSLYFGVRDKNLEPHEAGNVRIVDGKITINMNDEKLPPLITDAATKERFSFHGSGEIHDGQVGHTTYREPIIQTTEQSELFWVCFKELCFFEEIQQLRKNDICLNINIPKNHALMLHALIAPSDKVQLNGINNGKDNVFVVINFQGVALVGDISLQLVFAPNPEPEAPQRSVVVWSTKDIENLEDEGRTCSER